ncbi:alpha/beta fold hydrolase [Thalassococcus lentus]|uniref:Alpha/beta hydrolase n=1 Tax=Thalassococcus lentus TaxID=1210524 RepID=A0ABT4XMP0_9RHOB|nr:alpha/beta hydrolase [Thalassococcus lentus]MDA7423207.1 alpha/beta hydrolase [Thalassococcus lentus]
MELFSREFGNGPEAALFLHCGLGRSGMWKAVAGHLSDQLTVCAPDLPGHGRSPGWPNGDPHDVATEAVRPFLREGMHLVGHSFGATLALRLSLEVPDAVASLTLVEPVFFAAAPSGPIRDAHRAAEEEFFAVFETGGALEAARVFNRLWGGGVPWAQFPAEAQQAMADNMPFVVGTEPSLWQDSAGLLQGAGLKTLKMPVALLRGSETVPMIAEVHKGLTERLTTAEETVVSGAAHMLVMTHPKDVADAIRTNIDRAKR